MWINVALALGIQSLGIYIYLSEAISWFKFEQNIKIIQ
jgi:hypothetical protein